MDAAKKRELVKSLPGFTALWDFKSRNAEGLLSAYTPDSECAYPLTPANLLRDYWEKGEIPTMEDIPCLDKGPFGGSVLFDSNLQFSTDKEMYYYLKIDRNRIHDSPLDIKGKQPFTLLTWVIKHKDRSNHFISGIWHEGTDLRDCTIVEKGCRQFALFGGLAANPGAVGGHISDTGGGSFGDLYARHIAVTKDKIPVCDLDRADGLKSEKWQCLAMTYNPDKGEVTTSLNGRIEDYWIDNPRESRVYRHHAGAPESYSPPAGFVVNNPSPMSSLKVNPYWFGEPIYCPEDVSEGAPFTIGRAVSSFLDAGFTGLIGGVALFRSSLGEGELQSLSSTEFLEDI